MLVIDYKNYLLQRGYSESVAKFYSNKLNKFLKTGYSENDLIGAAFQLFVDYSRGGRFFDVNDHSNTSNALKHLNEYILQDYLENFEIKYVKNRQVFDDTDKHIIQYTIKNKKILILYSDCSKEIKNINDTNYLNLVYLTKNYYNYLSEHNFIYTVHKPALLDYSQPVNYYYTIKNKTASGTEYIFEHDDYKIKNKLNNKYVNIINKILNN